MFQAQLRGKLTRTEENMEDLLTSNVFGTMKYLPFEDGLGLILSNSVDNEGKMLSNILSPIADVEYQFWPWIQESDCEGCEPDLSIIMQTKNEQKFIVFVEAKYLSGKSSEADEGQVPRDQLAREWDNLLCLATRENAIPILLYVTADIGYPSDDIEASYGEYKKKRKKDMKVFWISWRKLPYLFSVKDNPMLTDLVMVLKLQSLTFFEGIKKVEPIIIHWSFKGKVDWNWSAYFCIPLSWRYKHNNYNWKYQIEQQRWRFVN
jgi:hypothetical protein